MQYFNKTQINWRISTCCQFADPSLSKLYNLGTTTKTYALKADGKQKVQSKAIDNCKKLLATVQYLTTKPINLRSFRISSELLPCYTLDFTKDWYAEIEPQIKSILQKAGEIAKNNEIRLSTHPAQFTVLGSNDSNVVKNSIQDLEYHALFGQYMQLPPEDFVINIHLQGLYGGKHIDGIRRFANNFAYLSDYAKKALAVENEDKPNGYDIKHVLDLCSKIHTRATLDVHHYLCHRMTTITDKSGNYKNRDINPIRHTDSYFKEAVATWAGNRPLFHVSQSIDSPEYAMKPNAHSDYLLDEELNSVWVPMLEYADFDIEAKQKELAVNQIYQYILQEELYAGEKLKCAC